MTRALFQHAYEQGRSLLGRRVLRVAVAAFAAAVLAPCVYGQAQFSADEVVARMEAVREADRDKQLPYTMRRQYQLFPQEEPDKRGQVIARIEYLPPDRKQYRIEQSSGGMVERVAHRILEREVDPAQTATGEISRENYKFQSVGMEPCGESKCYVLKMEPFHERKDTMRGNVWIDADTFRIRKAEGISAKTPSFMIRQVQVSLEYGMVEGMWLQRLTRAVADVRFKGKYEMVSREIGCEVARVRKPDQRTVATNRSNAPRTRANMEQRSAAASAIFLGR